ncbi:BspA family leucine-rich repeat surface protein [uncultured Aquimarina sp.]|uniref:BspA family leucine-rich repeat surface protein n=1 Tax=uncultured Aquimarina sp. TaxID=575652 RepID=UPI00260AF02E|nr:BspA family leucine-rich repeat surface protein [uncultured Aquimarina sp.]
MKHFYLTLFFVVSFFSTAFAQDTFRMKIRISSSNETFTIPTNINETYNYDVRWSDPYQSGGITIITAFENGFTGDATHSYTEARDYIITIRGTFPRIFFANAGDTQKVVSIEQWGNNTWTSMREAFNGCTNLEINATDTPNLSNCTDMQEMFRECISLKDNGGAVQNWNVSTITNFNRTFARAPIDETFGNWNVSNATTMVDMFEGIQLSSGNYDDTLDRWALLSLNNNVVFSAGNSTYCNASVARNNILTNPGGFNWTITDGGEACDEDKFITTWETTIANETITIPTAGSGYNYTVNWGDGSISVGNTSDVTHTFETPGIHNIEIYGDFPRIYFDNSGDRSKILTIEQWGKQQWTNMNSAFEGCNNLKLNADDTPDLSLVTSMEKMFRGTSNLEDLKGIIGSWNTGNIINMSSLFRFSGFNENINAWNVANVQEMGLIFGGTSTFNQPLNNWDVRNVTSLNLAFSNARKFNQDISSWKLQSLANTVGIENLFINATDFNQNLGALDLSNIPDSSQLNSFFVGTSMSQENYEATLIGWATLDIANGETRIPRDVPLNSSGLSYCNAAAARQSLIIEESWTISGDAINCMEADKFITTWQTTSNNESIQIRTSGGGSFYNVEWGDGTTSENQGGNSSHTYATAGTYTVKISGAFARLYTNNFFSIGNKMRSVEQWGTGEWSSFDRAFEGAGNVVINATDIPDLSNVTNMFNAFKDCRKLVDNGGQMQNWDVSTVENFRSTFQGASVFNEDMGNWDVSNATDLANMLNGTNLSTANYDATLIGWAENPNTPDNLNLGASGLTYCLGESARNTLDIDKNWGINDGGSACATTDFFITTWRTTTANQSITIPTIGSGYNYDIDWGDGTFEFGYTGNASHMYSSAGVYKVKITGDFPRIYFNNTGDKDVITSIDQWGTQQWTSMERAFYGCTALELNVSDAPDLTQATSLERMFMGTNNFVDNEASMNSWNTSTITNMANMFADSIFDFNITSWDVGKVENFVGMFNNNAQFNQNISGWNVGEFVTGSISMQAMFDSASRFNQSLNTWDISKVTNMVSMFGFATAFNQPLDAWDTSTVENMGGMFFGASGFDQNVGDWNLSSVTNMGAMFQQSGLSTENYDATLIGWAKQDAGETIPSNISISFEGSQYCFGAEARNTLVDDTGLNWSISDDGSACASTDFFITTWETTAANESITIPTTGSGYDYNIDWGDGTIELRNTGNASHSYSTVGNYTVKILGDFPQFASLAGGISNAEKLRTIEQWGTIEWRSMLQAFSRCSNMNITAMDTPNLSNVTAMDQMFFGCTNLQSPDLSGWDTSNATSMSWMFINAINFNGNIANWDVGNVTDFTLMLAGARSFNQNISNWNIGEHVTGTITMNSMFTGSSSFDQNLGNWNLQKVIDINAMLDNSGLSVANYDATLMGWASNTNTPNGLVLGADGLTYCVGEVSRNILTTAPYNWTIDDAGSDCNDAFITTWETTTTNESITVPTTGSGYNYAVDWGDGSIEGGFTGNATHEYVTAGTYEVKLIGDFPRIFFNSTGDKDKILSIEQWGAQQWQGMQSAFRGCTNLVINATDVPDLSIIQFMDSMFSGTTSFVDNGGEMNNWNITNVISLVSLFEGSVFNENINNWNVSGVQTMGNMFQDNTAFNQPLDQWIPENVSDFEHMFNGATSFNQPIGDWTMTSAAFFESMFEGTASFDQDLGNWDISTTDRDGMINMFVGSGMSTENYDATLIGWATLEAGETQIPVNVQLDADATYCLGEGARNTLTSAPYNWTITDGGLSVDCNVQFSPKVYLQGAAINPYTGEESLMRDDLHRDNIIPVNSPYADGIALDPGIFSVLDQNALVDWVWVELRDATDNITVVASKSALLQRDGDILDENYQTLSFSIPAGEYYIVIKHRNHLGIMSNETIALDNSTTSVDFTNGSIATYGNNAQTTFSMPSGLSGMWAGDANEDGKINLIGSSNDSNTIRDVILNDPINLPIQFYGFNVTGYNDADVNLSGGAQIIGANNDANLVRDNILNHPINTFIQFYGFNITEQLPENVSVKRVAKDKIMEQKMNALAIKNN